MVTPAETDMRPQKAQVPRLAWRGRAKVIGWGEIHRAMKRIRHVLGIFWKILFPEKSRGILSAAFACLDWRERLVNVRPHPSPLPRREGELRRAVGKFSRSGCSRGHSFVRPGRATLLVTGLVIAFAETGRAEEMAAAAATNNVVQNTPGTNSSPILDPAHVQPIGSWIWAHETHDKQICHLWKSFELPAPAFVTKARLAITADNGYRVFLDGREVGRGSSWTWITFYDLSRILNPGRHVLAVEGFND